MAIVCVERPRSSRRGVGDSKTRARLGPAVADARACWFSMLVDVRLGPAEATGGVGSVTV